MDGRCQYVIVLCASHTLQSEVTIALRAHHGSNIDVIVPDDVEREHIFEFFQESHPGVLSVHRQQTPPSTHIPTLRLMRPARAGGAHTSRFRPRQNRERPRIVRRILPE